MGRQNTVFPERSEPATLLGLLSARAEQSDKTAYIFLEDGEGAELRLSYRQLERRALAIAAVLQQHKARGERVLLLFQAGLDYVAAFFGCLYAGAVAVPAYPPRPHRPLTSIEAIVADARATLILTTGALQCTLQERFGHQPDLVWLAVEAIEDNLAEAWRDPLVGPETIAFLQYTSGSTGRPKGVVLTHANLLHNQRLIRERFDHDETTVFVGWLPLFHDMGLIGNVLQPLYLGIPCTLMAPGHFLQKPVRWLEAISRYGATTSGGPNFAYELCLRRVNEQQRATLDLSRWRVAFNGAEPVRAETLERFSAFFAPAGFRREAFYPCYGLAEASLLVSGGAPEREPIVRHFGREALERGVAAQAEGAAPSRLLVGCGEADRLGQRLVIADPERHTLCPQGTVGEIWVMGPSIAAGYWRNEEASLATFGASLNDGSGPFLRTGDLGFVEGGELFVAGRLKDLIIVAGRNYYPQDIEQSVEQSHPDLQPAGAAAFTVDTGTGEELVVVQEVERQALRRLNVEAVATAIRRAVAEECDLAVEAVVLLRPGALPRTSSGKVRRRACRDAYLAGDLAVVGEVRTPEVEEQSATLDRVTLLTASPPERRQQLEAFLAARACLLLRSGSIQPDLPLDRLGFDSLKATELQYAVEESLGITLPMSAVLRGATLSELAGQIEQKLEARPVPALIGAEVANAGIEQLSTEQVDILLARLLAEESL